MNKIIYIFGLLFVLSLWVESVHAQRSQIEQLCRNDTSENCQRCQNYLREGWRAHRDSIYGRAIFQYTLALGENYFPATDLINNLIDDDEYQLNRLRKTILEQQQKIEASLFSLDSAAYAGTGKDSLINHLKTDLNQTYQQLEKKGQRVESLFVPGISERLRRQDSSETALYLAYYSTLLQSSQQKSPAATKALMEASIQNEDLSPAIFADKEIINQIKLLDDQLLITTKDKLFLLKNEQTLRIPTQLNFPLSIQIAPDQQSIALLDEKGKLEIWQINNLQTLVTLNTSYQNNLFRSAFSNDGRQFVLANQRTAQAFIVDIATGDTTALIHQGGKIYDIAFAKNDRRFLTRHADGKVTIWNRTGQFINTIGQNELFIHTAQFMPENDRLLLTGNIQGVMKIWDIDQNKVIDTIREDHAIKAIHPLADRSLIYHSSNKLVYQNQQRDTAFQIEQIAAIKLNPQQTKAVVWTKMGDLHKFDVANRTLTKLDGQQKNIHDVAFSSDGKWLSTTALNGEVKLWDENDDVVLVWNLPTEDPIVAYFTKDNRHIYLVNTNGRKLLRSALPVEIIRQLEPRKQDIKKYLAKRQQTYDLQYLKTI